MASAALAIYLVGLALMFGWKALTQVRSTGDTGFRGLSGRVGSAPWWGGVLFAVAVLCGAAAPALALAGAIVPPAGLEHPVIAAAGVVMAILGLVAVLAAQHRMGTSWRVGVDENERTRLVTEGVFARVRNPIFTAMVLFGIGVALMVPTVVAGLAVVALVTAVHLQVRAVEEPYLIATHGSAYVDYAGRTGRFLPRVPLRRRST